MAWVLPPRLEVTVDGVPVELTDPGHPVWHGASAVYVDYMAQRGWHLPVDERMFLLGLSGDTGAPTRRRLAAVEGWAVDVGITSPKYPHSADYHRLRAMGLLSDRGNHG